MELSLEDLNLLDSSLKLQMHTTYDLKPLEFPPGFERIRTQVDEEITNFKSVRFKNPTKVKMEFSLDDLYILSGSLGLLYISTNNIFHTLLTINYMKASDTTNPVAKLCMKCLELQSAIWEEARRCITRGL